MLWDRQRLSGQRATLQLVWEVTDKSLYITMNELKTYLVDPFTYVKLIGSARSMVLL